ncbi:MAG: hypothetical protein A2Z04_09145 [Chloroflexi bacterium RBG_16_57_9]|nr:MAG: hypothetical protein A2Z04_09145 [Chloroflexi bacterium RBG_16_57_9]
MAKTIPVMYRNGVLVPQVELEGLNEGQRFYVQVPDVEELDLISGNGDESWIGFISPEDALQIVERTAGSWGTLPPDLAQWIIESEDVLEGNLPL